MDGTDFYSGSKVIGRLAVIAEISLPITFDIGKLKPIFGAIIRRYWKNASWSCGDELSDGMTRLALLVIVLIAIDQLKIEFLRFGTVDYLQFVFALLAIYLGIGDSKVLADRSTVPAVREQTAPLQR